ncbi:hypothetical protein LA080_000971 [Diaporthe eres]|uniref:F-box domain-containing protein n=1 Tax=Diaporthe vaccinii TaxID=105482 RepID=A0ABR4FCM0_9PEZI|nr:hypothetical protein LA080_000971 [Diaporthe eres]
MSWSAWRDAWDHDGGQQNPVSRRRLARDITEMVNDPYTNAELIPNRSSLDHACLILRTGTRLVHVSLRFRADYPRTPPYTYIDGRVRHPGPDVLLWSASLASQNEDKSAYTIKTFAMHLLSMFDGDTELAASPDGIEFRTQSKWEAYKCSRCGIGILQNGSLDFEYWMIHRYYQSGRQRILDFTMDDLTGPTEPRTIQSTLSIHDLPVEILNKILNHLEIQDIVRFGQAWGKIEDIIETNVVIHDRELQCFVTKEHFTHSPLGIGICDNEHDDDDDSRPAPFKLESEFDLISQTAFRDLGIRTSAYGYGVDEWLPLPLSERHWEQVKGDTFQCLDRLAETMHSGFRVSPNSDALDVLTTLMDNHAVKLFTNVDRQSTHGGTSGEETTGRLQASEKGIESMFFLFHLLLCVAVAKPEFVEKANNMVRSFCAGSPPAQDMPSPGRILVALLISDVKVDTSFMARVVTEAITRNVPALLTRHPELAHLEPDGAASAYRLHHTFTGNLASYRALMFMDVFQRTVRPSTNGTALKQARDALFHRRGFPPSAKTTHLAAETRRVLAADSLRSFLAYLGMLPVPGARILSGCLRDTVREGLRRGNVLAWPLDQAAVLVLRRTAEHWSTLPRTERLPPCPEWPPPWEVIARAQGLGYYPDRTH